ncbi:MAG: DUF362 domain-containing protein [Candidatus Omnitrophica bacterium]|nr:DUF362 domain-containing protein [Candidatus Omnitrophota bacterium]
MNPTVSIVNCASYDPRLVEERVRKALDLLGGISVFIKPGSRVLLKPNLLMAKEPALGITTHPEVVRAVIRILKEINCAVYLGDSPSVWGRYIENVGQVYERTGMKKVCAEEGAELVMFDKRRMREKFPLTTWLDNCDYLINLPRFKTHELTLLSGAIKNLFGLVCGTFKTELHKNYFDIEEFCDIIVDIFQEAKPALTIVDGITAMEGDGPATAGKLRNTRLLLASYDCVALDSILALIMGVKPYDVLTTKEAAHRGLGIPDARYIDIVGEELKSVIGEPFILPTTSIVRKGLPQPVIKAARKLIKYYPTPMRQNCIRCNACIQACPTKCISMDEKGIIVDYNKCIACFCCQESCPAHAIKVKKSFLAKLIGL